MLLFVVSTAVQEYRKVAELSDKMLVAAAGDQGAVEMFVEWLKVRRACMHSAVGVPL